eukprot:scaffold1821_cov98-Isochrysis_galbana.AAC.1
MSSPLTSAPHTDARSPRTARSKNWMIFRKYPTYRLPSAYRWYSVPTKRPEAKQAHAETTDSRQQTVRIRRKTGASGRMRRDTLLSPGRLALPPLSPPPFTVPPGARPIISGLHGCGGWLGLVLYIGPGW